MLTRPHSRTTRWAFDIDQLEDATQAGDALLAAHMLHRQVGCFFPTFAKNCVMASLSPRQVQGRTGYLSYYSAARTAVAKTKVPSKCNLQPADGPRMCRVATREAIHHYICVVLGPSLSLRCFGDPDMDLLYVWGAADQAMASLAVPSQKELSADLNSWGRLHAGCIVYCAGC